MSVGYSTGTPNINLPLYELKSHDLSVPISISYLSTGLQVEGTASSTGLGWSLNAGGSISRTQFGKDDFAFLGYATNQNILPSFGTEPDFNVSGSPRAAYELAFLLFEEFGTNGGDFEPDLFNFSINGRSGKFVHDTQGNPHTIPYQAVEIIRYYTSSTRSAYKIVDENGIQYYFDEGETTKLVENQYCPFNIKSPAPVPFISGYRLHKMISPSGDSINFEYEADLSTYQTPPNAARFDLQIGCSDCRPIPLQANPCAEKAVHIGSRIKRIVTANGQQVVFDYDEAERLDLVKNNRLRAVIILDKEGTQIHRFDLFHSYFLGSSETDPDPLVQSKTYRLRLDSLQESGKPAHKFGYEHQNEVFPNRLAYSQDLWGYYNREDNTTLYPAMQYGDRFYAGAKRAVDTVGTKFGMLRSICYPTGGRTVFDFENNRLDDAITPVDSTIAAGVHAYTNDFDNTHSVDKASLTFTVTHTERIRLNYSFDLSQPAQEFVGAHAFGTLTGAATGLSNHYQCIQGKSCSDEIFVTLQPDIYTVTLGADANSNNSDAVGSMSITRTSLKSTINPQYAGGCRIRRITDYSRENQVASLRTFVYKLPITGSSSGVPGVRPVLSYTQNIKHYNSVSGVTETNTYLVRVPRSTIPQNAIQGGNISYACVTELHGRQGEGGKSEYYFEAVGDEPSHLGYPFTPPISYDWMRGQLVKQIDYRKAGNAYQMIKAVRQQYTRYFDRTSFFSGTTTPVHQVIIPGFVAACILPQYYHSSLDNSSFTLVPGEYTFHWYYYISAWQYLKSTTEVLYSTVDTTRQSVTVTRYRYDNPAHLQLTQLSKSISSQDSTWKQFRYPLDYTIPTGTTSSSVLQGIRWLQQHHQLTPVLEQNEGTKQGSTSRVTAGSYTSYTFGQPWQSYLLNIAAPLEQQQFVVSTVQNGQLQRDPHYQMREEIALRDPVGNVLQVEKDHVSTSFIWGYNQSLVVAKIAHANYSQIGYSSFENRELNSWTGSSQGIQLEQAYSGKASYLLRVGSLSKTALAPGTYLLSAWIREGSGTVFANAQPFIATATMVKGWRLYRTEMVLVVSTTVTVSGTGQIDDLRLYPKDAQMITYTHEPMVGVTSRTDVDGRTAIFEYDALGRLLRTRDEQGRILSQEQYHYSGH